MRGVSRESLETLPRTQDTTTRGQRPCPEGRNQTPRGTPSALAQNQNRSTVKPLPSSQGAAVAQPWSVCHDSYDCQESIVARGAGVEATVLYGTASAASGCWSDCVGGAEEAGGVDGCFDAAKAVKVGAVVIGEGTAGF